MNRCAAILLLCAVPALLGAAPAHLEDVPTNAGFIYAKLTWPDGETGTGFLRWEDEEAFWDDLFHAGQRDLPWTEYADLDQLRAERRNRVYAKKGLFDRIIYALTEDDDDPVQWRIYLARMGDIASIEIHDGEDDFAIMPDGTRFEIGGYANDAGSDLILFEEGADPQEIEWNDLTSIQFLATPPDAVPYAERLYGTLETAEGTFTGFIQWDKTECLSIDILDGEDPEGNSHDVAMGGIRSIVRRDGKSAEVALDDGRNLVLSGTNDVNRGNRGIMVEVPDIGRISVPWKKFKRLDLESAGRSGLAREQFEGNVPLSGTVTLTEGPPMSGRLVIDLDKAWAWNFFSGTWKDLDYDVPMTLVQKIERLDDERCRLTLDSGRTLELSESTETGVENAGLLVIGAGNQEPRYVPWRMVRTIELDQSQ